MAVEKKALKETIYEKIKENIVSRKYPEGAYLIERKIAEELFTSRTPVREAFKQLEKEGWIEYKKNYGMRVVTLNVQEMEDVFEVRRLLEPQAAVNSCECIKWDDLQKMRSCIDRQTIAKNNEDWNSFIDEDLEFHNIIVNAQQNEILKNILLSLRSKSKLYGIRILFGDKGRLQLTLDEHMKIYHSILIRDSQAVRQYMADHVQSVYEAAHDYLDIIQ